jgi:hypothetical protein
VRVGQDVAVGADDEAGAFAARGRGLAAARIAELAEEMFGSAAATAGSLADATAGTGADRAAAAGSVPSAVAEGGWVQAAARMSKKTGMSRRMDACMEAPE